MQYDLNKNNNNYTPNRFIPQNEFQDQNIEYNFNINEYNYKSNSNKKKMMNSSSSDFIFHKKTLQPHNNQIINEETNLDSTTSNNSFLSSTGTDLVMQDKKNLKPITYTSQCFFIDKEYYNLQESHFRKISKTPMRMKGDFEKMMEKHPEFIYKTNPRIQVTNAQYPIEYILNEDVEKGDVGVYGKPSLNNQLISQKIIEKCDRDIYDKNVMIYSSNDIIKVKNKENKIKKYSISFPIKDNNTTKWNMLNNIKGQRDKNNSNKFELIQTGLYKLNNNDVNVYNNSSNNDIKKTKTMNLQYRLREMNMTQFYKTIDKVTERQKLEDNLFYEHKRIKKPFVYYKTKTIAGNFEGKMKKIFEFNNNDNNRTKTVNIKKK